MNNDQLKAKLVTYGLEAWMVSINTDDELYVDYDDLKNLTAEGKKFVQAQVLEHTDKSLFIKAKA